MSTVCTIVSSVAHDVRTAQQGVWFVVFFGTLICGFLLTSTLPEGVGMLLVVSLIGALGAVAAIVIGSVVIQRDLGR
jgi:ABC-type Na+ efflux pump permease subunit